MQVDVAAAIHENLMELGIERTLLQQNLFAVPYSSHSDKLVTRDANTFCCMNPETG